MNISKISEFSHFVYHGIRNHKLLSAALVIVSALAYRILFSSKTQPKVPLSNFKIKPCLSNPSLLTGSTTFLYVSDFIFFEFLNQPKIEEGWSIVCKIKYSNYRPAEPGMVAVEKLIKSGQAYTLPAGSMDGFDATTTLYNRAGEVVDEKTVFIDFKLTVQGYGG